MEQTVGSSRAAVMLRISPMFIASSIDEQIQIGLICMTLETEEQHDGNGSIISLGIMTKSKQSIISSDNSTQSWAAS